MNYLSPSSSPSVYLYLCYCCWGPKSCPTLGNLDPMDCSPPGFSVHGTSQARILEWVAISFSRRSSWPRDLCLQHWQVNSFPLSHQGTPFISMCVCVLSHFSHVWLFATIWTEFCQAPLSMGFSRKEEWSGLPYPPPDGIFLTQELNLRFLHLLHWQVGSLPLAPPVSILKQDSQLVSVTVQVQKAEEDQCFS